MKNKRFLFLAAWLQDSPSHEDNWLPDTDVNDQEDLLKEYKSGNENVLVVDIFAPNSDMADAIGWRHAITEGAGSYTLEDTVSTVFEIDIKKKLAPVNKHIEVPRFTVTEDGIVEDISG